MSPPEWPGDHPYAADFDEFWLVQDIPPEPWPEWHPGDWSLEKYGPPGTVWHYSMAQLRNRLTFTGFSQGYLAAINVIARQVEAAGLPPEHTQTWTNPGVLSAPPPGQGAELMTVKCLRTTIHGKLGPDEEVAHVLHWVTAPTGGVAMDAAAVRAFGDSVRAAWQAFFMGTSGRVAVGNVSDAFTQDLVYDEVRTSYVNIPASAKETYDVLTQYSPFVPGAVHGTANASSLPYEVACAMSLGTNFRDKRARGRTYMGGLTPIVMGQGGKFDAANIQAIAGKFGSAFVAVVNAGPVADLHVVSRKYGTSAPVQGVRVGVVPDSQRRRRRSQAEAHTLVWGQGVGAVA